MSGLSKLEKLAFENVNLKNENTNSKNENEIRGSEKTFCENENANSKNENENENAPLSSDPLSLSLCPVCGLGDYWTDPSNITRCFYCNPPPTFNFVAELHHVAIQLGSGVVQIESELLARNARRRQIEVSDRRVRTRAAKRGEGGGGGFASNNPNPPDPLAALSALSDPDLWTSTLAPDGHAIHTRIGWERHLDLHLAHPSGRPLSFAEQDERWRGGVEEMPQIMQWCGWW